MKVLAILNFEAQKCSGCGGYLPGTANPDVAMWRLRRTGVFRCDALQTEQRGYAESRNPSALTVWPVDRVDD